MAYEHMIDGMGSTKNRVGFKMKLTFSTSYTQDERMLIDKNRCEILKEVKLSSAPLTDIPRRMIRYGGSYIAEIEQDEELCWAVLSKWRGQYRFTECYPDLQSMIDGL